MVLQTNDSPAGAGVQAGERLIGTREFWTALGVAKRTFYRWLKEKKLPEPIRLGNRRLKWRSGAVEAFLNELDRTKSLTT